MEKKLVYGLPKYKSKVEVVDFVAEQMVEVMRDYKIARYAIHDTYLEIIVEYESPEYYVGVNKELREENKELKLKIEILEKMIKDLS